MEEEFSLISNSEAETCEIAQKIAPLFRAGDILILDGELGAGKTYFVKGFSAGLHTDDLVSSPTFSIANFYRTGLSDLLHIDLYRIATVDELNDLGLSDYFGQSITLIEWGKRFAEYFEDFLLISFIIKFDNTRILTFRSQGDKYRSRIEELKQSLKEENLC